MCAWLPELDMMSWEAASGTWMCRTIWLPSGACGAFRRVTDPLHRPYAVCVAGSRAPVITDS